MLPSAAAYLVEVSPIECVERQVSGGTASLAGTVQAVFAPGSYCARTYTILSAAGGLGGTRFNSLTTANLPAGFAASLSYTATDVILNLTASSGAIGYRAERRINATSPPRSTTSSTTAARCRPASSACSGSPAAISAMR